MKYSGMSAPLCKLQDTTVAADSAIPREVSNSTLDFDASYVLSPDVTMMIGREPTSMCIANRRVKIEPEEPSHLTIRRVGFIDGTTDLAFSDLVRRACKSRLRPRRVSQPQGWFLPRLL